MGKGRVEAFSDGVLAIVITLLVLDLHVEVGAGHASVGQQLRNEWPSFAAYVVSFFVVGVIWINHHALLSLAARVDRELLFLNLLLLLFVTTIPFTTAVLADTLREGGADARWGAVLYGISSWGMAVAFTLMLRRMVTHGLLHRPVTPAEGRRAQLRFGLGTLVYPLVTIVGLVSAPVMLALYAVLTGYYALEQTPILPGTVSPGGS